MLGIILYTFVSEVKMCPHLVIIKCNYVCVQPED